MTTATGPAVSPLQRSRRRQPGVGRNRQGARPGHDRDHRPGARGHPGPGPPDDDGRPGAPRARVLPNMRAGRASDGAATGAVSRRLGLDLGRSGLPKDCSVRGVGGRWGSGTPALSRFLHRAGAVRTVKLTCCWRALEWIRRCRCVRCLRRRGDRDWLLPARRCRQLVATLGVDRRRCPRA
jgi:hypothetical protein